MLKTTKLLTIAGLVAALALTTVSATTLTFSDTSDDTYLMGIEYLAGEGIVDGHDDGTFKPLDTLNRAEMLKIIAEAYFIVNDLDNSELENYADKECFDDVPTDAWFTKYVCFGKTKGWVEGYEEGKIFKPSQTVSFVEGLKITLEGLGLDYEATPDVWYRGLVNAASAKNYIPYTITAFDNGLQRNEMSDLIARILTDKEDSLDDYLLDLSELVVSYETIKAGIDLSNVECTGLNEPLGAVVPGNTSYCCEGLEAYIDPEIVGTKGVCVETGTEPELESECDEGSDFRVVEEGQELECCGDLERQTVKNLKGEELEYCDFPKEENTVSTEDWERYYNDSYEIPFSIKLPKLVQTWDGACEWDEENQTYGFAEADQALATFEGEEGLYIKPVERVDLSGETLDEYENPSYSQCDVVPNTAEYFDSLEWGTSFEIVTRQIETEEEIDQFLKDSYGEGCSTGKILETDQEGIYDVWIQGDGLGLGETLCPVNYATVIKYSPEKKAIASWDIGQDVNYMLGEEYYDFPISDSFKFE